VHPGPVFFLIRDSSAIGKKDNNMDIDIPRQFHYNTFMLKLNLGPVLMMVCVRLHNTNSLARKEERL